MAAREQPLAQREQLIAQHQVTSAQQTQTIAQVTQQRDEYYLEKLRLEVRLAQALKQAYGPRADRVSDPGQLLLDFAGRLAQALGYTLNQWPELTLFTRDGAGPLHNNLAEQQRKRSALLRKNSLFVATPRAGETAAILSRRTSPCRRPGVNPQRYLTQLLANLPDTPISQLDEWRPEQWQKTLADSPALPDQPVP